MTDGEVVKIARQMDTLLQRMHTLYERIRDSDHPHAAELAGRLKDHEIPPISWPTHIIASELEHPERWETCIYGIRKKGAKPS